jgi:hypothetical protein
MGWMDYNPGILTSMGSYSFPQIPYFGPRQATGVLIGQGIIALGFLMMISFRQK